MKVRLHFAALAALAVGLMACGSDDTKPPATTTDTGTPSDSGDTGTPPGDSGDTGTPPTDSGGGETSDAPSGPTCAAYCDKIMASCTGANAMYASKDDCNKACATQYGFKAGSAADTSGNTIGCRLYHAGVAGTDAAAATTHCPHASASGGNTCGTWCDVYCDTILRNCPAGGATEVYKDATTCMTACKLLKDTGKPGDTDTNTVQCRIYHAGVAGTDAASAITHCPHTGATSSTCTK